MSKGLNGPSGAPTGYVLAPGPQPRPALPGHFTSFFPQRLDEGGSASTGPRAGGGGGSLTHPLPVAVPLAAAVEVGMGPTGLLGDGEELGDGQV